MELLPCFCCLSPLVLLGAYLAYAPLLKRRPKEEEKVEEKEKVKEPPPFFDPDA